MKFTIIILTSLFLHVAHAQNHHEHSGHSKKSEKPTKATKKFQATDDLKIRMDKILGLMSELKNKKNNLKMVAEYGDKLTGVVNDIFTTCKLEPEADAAVHPLLALILEGAEEFKLSKYDSGHSKIHNALLDYENQFTHEGWKH